MIGRTISVGLQAHADDADVPVQQAASRGIIRKKRSTRKCLLLVQDQSMAEDCADIPHFQSCQMRPLITRHELPKVQPKSPGRPSNYATDEAPDERARDRKRLQRFRFKCHAKILIV